MNTLQSSPNPHDAQGMKAESYRDLQLLEEIASGSELSQRTLSSRLGIAVGLTNLLLRRMAKKGYIKIATVQRKRLSYLLTPEGIAEKTRLTYEYLDASLYLYRKVRQTLQESLGRLKDEGAKVIVLYGTGELAEVAYLTVKEIGLTLGAIVSDGGPGGEFLGYPTLGVGDVADLSFDCLIITSVDDADARLRRLRLAGVAEKKVLLLARQGPRIRAVYPADGSGAA